MKLFRRQEGPPVWTLHRRQPAKIDGKALLKLKSDLSSHGGSTEQLAPKLDELPTKVNTKPTDTNLIVNAHSWTPGGVTLVTAPPPNNT